jgi:muramidase (phage lysozyme)
MAQMTPEEFLETLETWAESLKNGTKATEADSAAMLEKIGVTKAMTKDMKALSASTAAFTKEMYHGKQGAAAMNNAVDGIASSLDLLVDGILAAVAVFGGPIGMVASGLGFLAKSAVKAGAEYTKAAAEMSDKLYKSYQDLSRVGAAGAEGMDAVYGSMQKFGYGVDELDKMTELVRANSKGLAAFSGTVLDGTNQLAATAETIQRSGLQTQFMNMGMSVDDINKGLAGYQMQQGRLGQLQGKTQAELTAGAAAYLKEMEGLTRLTGQQKEEMEAQREQANAVEQFYATVKEMPEDVQKQMYRVVNMMNAQDPSGRLARGFEDSISGFVGMSKEANQAFMATSGENMRAAEALKTRQIDAAQYMNRYTGALKQNMPYMLNAAKLGQAGETFGAVNVYGGMLGKNFEEAAEAADNQTNVTNELTDEATKLRQKQMQTRDSLQDFVKAGVKPATEALNALAGGARNAASVVPGAKSDKAPMGGDSGSWLRDLFGLGPAKVSGKSGALLDLIGKGESGGNYNALVGGKSADLTNMTIDQVQKLQSTMKAQGYASTAVGKYQMIASTLAEQAKKAGLDTSKTKFDQKTQDLLAQQLVNQAGVGKVDTATAMKNLAGTWASLPKDMSGRGAYDGYNTNKSNINPQDLVAALSGPSGGYKPSLANANPSTGLGSDKTAEAEYQKKLNSNSWDSNEVDEGQAQMISLLSENNALLRQSVGVQEKIKNNTA